VSSERQFLRRVRGGSYGASPASKIPEGNAARVRNDHYSRSSKNRLFYNRPSSPGKKKTSMLLV
jgi:hypothetical protein